MPPRQSESDKPDPLARFVNLPTDTELRETPTERLHELLAGIIGLSVEILAFGARVWRVLESREEDLSPYTQVIFKRIRQIACGALLPEVPIAFGLQSALFTRVSRLPPDEQRRLSAEGASVPVAVRDPKGAGWTHQNICVRNLEAAHLELVFDGQSVRNVEQQVAHLTQPLTEVEAPKGCRCRVDRANQKFYFGDVEIPLGDVCDALRRAKLKL